MGLTEPSFLERMELNGFTGSKETILKRDFSEEFVAKMKNAMLLSHYKYGYVSQTYPELAQAYKCIRERVMPKWIPVLERVPEENDEGVNLMDKLTNDEYLIAGTLADLIEKVKNGFMKKALARTRDELVCQNSKLGQYKCAVKLPFGPDDGRFCDMCLEGEIHELWRAGVHTVSSCCGHGRVPPYIQVLNGESVKKMHELGYVQIKNEACPDNPYPVYRAKTYLPCFTPCRECVKSEPIGDGTGWYCLEENFDTELDTFWCFVPEPPKEETE